MLDKKDLNKYNTTSIGTPSQRTEGELSQSAGATAKTVGGMFLKAVKTIICIMFVTGILVFLSVAAFLLSFRDIRAPESFRHVFELFQFCLCGRRTRQFHGIYDHL